MSVTALSWVLKKSPESVGGRRMVLVVLADHANDEGQDTCPSIPTIAHGAKLSDRSAQRALRALEIAGAIRSTGTHPVYKTTVYEVIMDGSAVDSAPWSDEEIRTLQGGDATSPRRDAHEGVTPTSGEPSSTQTLSNESAGDEPPAVPEDDFMKVQEEPEAERLFEAKTETDAVVERVWQHFCEVNHPVRPEMSPSQKRMIERTLKECSEQEACLAIDGNRASAWHRERSKHSLSDIFKPNYQRRETIRQRVDRFIQDAQRAGKGPVVPSVDRGKVQRHKDNVIQGSTEGAGDHAKKLAVESREWLEAHGWQVEHIDGWPRFTERSE